MQTFVEKHLSPDADLRIIDIGSFDVNGSYRPLFVNPKWSYTGADRRTGNNVDIVLAKNFEWDELETAGYDVAISGQTVEHVHDPFKFFIAVRRIVKQEGLFCCISPSRGPLHHPPDYWRIQPQGIKYLASSSGFEVIDLIHQPKNFWGDICLIAKKTIVPTKPRN
jgi:SAM-dependent methyltransferase